MALRTKPVVRTAAVQNFGYGILVLGHTFPAWMHTEVFATPEAAAAAVAKLDEKFPIQKRVIIPLNIEVPVV